MPRYIPILFLALLGAVVVNALAPGVQACAERISASIAQIHDTPAADADGIEFRTKGAQ